MRTTNDTFKQEKNKPANQPIFLYTIYDYDGLNNNLYFAEYDEDVVYNGITYIRFPITHEFIGENTQGSVDSLKVMISNVSREIQAYLELYEFRNKKVDVMLVWANQLQDPNAYIKDTYYIDSISATEEAVSFALTSKFDLLDVTIPNRKYSRNYCSWKFKSTECGYAGAETLCNKTFQRCQALNNRLRFGGFPSIPSRRIYAG